MRIFLFILLFFITGCVFNITKGENLIGKSKSAIEFSFGEPAVSRTESPNEVYIYKKGSCAILIYFDSSQTVRYVDYSGDCS